MCYWAFSGLSSISIPEKEVIRPSNGYAFDQVNGQYTATLPSYDHNHRVNCVGKGKERNLGQLP